jgi:hypothetical protein
MAMVSPPGAAAAVGHHRAPARDAPAKARETLRREQLPGGHRHRGGIREVAVAIGEGELDRLDQHVDVVRLLERGEIEALRQTQQGQRRHALGGRRKARGHAAVPGQHQRVHPLGPVRGEVPHAQRAARVGRGGSEAVRERASVEGVGAAVANRLERAREVRLDERAARQRIGMIERPEVAADLPARGGSEEIRLARRRPPLPRGGGEALGRVDDGVGEEIVPVERRAHGGRAVAVGLPPAIHRARHGQGGQPAPRGNRVADAARRVPLDARRRGGASGAAERAQPPCPRVPDQPEVVAPDPVHVGIHHGDGGGGGDRGIQRVAAAAERGDAGL